MQCCLHLPPWHTVSHFVVGLVHIRASSQILWHAEKRVYGEIITMLHATWEDPFNPVQYIHYLTSFHSVPMDEELCARGCVAPSSADAKPPLAASRAPVAFRSADLLHSARCVRYGRKIYIQVLYHIGKIIRGLG